MVDVGWRGWAGLKTGPSGHDAEFWRIVVHVPKLIGACGVSDVLSLDGSALGDVYALLSGHTHEIFLHHDAGACGVPHLQIGCVFCMKLVSSATEEGNHSSTPLSQNFQRAVPATIQHSRTAAGWWCGMIWCVVLQWSGEEWSEVQQSAV